MSEIAIHVEGLGKRYRLGVRQRYRTLRDTIAGAVTGSRQWAGSLVTGRRSPPSAALEETFWALREVSFDVKPGEVVGIIGRNGAGKSTLLKILSRITEPTMGYADVYGRLGALLEVGTGFHPELTGRENIYLSGAILGMRKRDIDRRFDEIVSFAEVERFLETPIKHYSSGMYVRLAFAVAAHLEPDILLVDEVLAVGDATFQKKCLGRMSRVAKEGRTVLFVSHNLAAVNRLCQRVIWIDGGRVRLDGVPEHIVPAYLTSSAVLTGRCHWEEGMANPGVDELKIDEVSIVNADGVVTSTVDVRQPFWIELSYRILRPLPHCRIGFILSTADGIPVLEAYDADDERYAGPREPGRFLLRCEIPGQLLNANRYVLSVNAGMLHVKNLAFLEEIIAFDLEETGVSGSQMGQPRSAIIRPPLHWVREAADMPLPA